LQRPTDLGDLCHIYGAPATQLEAPPPGKLAERNWGSGRALPPTWTSGCGGARKLSVGSDTLSTFGEAICSIGWTGGSMELSEFLTGPHINVVGSGALRAEGCVAPLPVRITLSGLPCSSIHFAHSLMRIRAPWWPMLILVNVLCRAGWRHRCRGALDGGVGA
jgi:hypothetical protein